MFCEPTCTNSFFKIYFRVEQKLAASAKLMDVTKKSWIFNQTHKRIQNHTQNWTQNWTQNQTEQALQSIVSSFPLIPKFW